MDESSIGLSCCAYCHTLREQKVVEIINSCEGVTAISPEKLKKERRQGKWELCNKRLLPGYVFIYGNDGARIIDAAKKANVIVLRYGDGSWQLEGGDYEFAKWVFEHNGLIEIVKAVKSGDTIKIIDGPFANIKGRVIQIDKRRQLIKVQLDINDFQIWLSFDYFTVENEE